MFDPDLKQVRSRFNLVQGLTNQFWKNWTTLYFPSLLIRQKWHTSKRNLCVGDVCLLQDSNCLRGEWRLCKVSETYPDIHGRVRNMEVQVSSKQSGSVQDMPLATSRLKRHVNSLVLLVPADENGAGVN